MAAAMLMAAPAQATMVGRAPANERFEATGELGLHYTKRGEALLDVAMNYGLGFVELRAANPEIDPWLIPEGTPIILPMQHLLPDRAEWGILVNRGDLRLYFFPKGNGPVRSWPISTGREEYETPLGLQHVTQLTRNPTWIPTATHRSEDPTVPSRVPPGPDNPLGKFRVRVGWDGYAIHGTNKPEGIGRRVSRGCIRMYPVHIEELFDLAKVGMPVAISHQPVKFGWIGDELYVQVHPSAEEIDRLESGQKMGPHKLDTLSELAFKAAGREVGRVNWHALFTAADQRRGLPVRITK
ncbi:MAG: L,D-transpeptidase family protein [Alphaproteobacteria bacterium]